jgi:hypothetical protein
LLEVLVEDLEDFSVLAVEEQEDCLQELFQVHQVLTLSQSEVVAVVLAVHQEVVTEVTHLFQV